MTFGPANEYKNRKKVERGGGGKIQLKENNE